MCVESQPASLKALFKLHDDALNGCDHGKKSVAGSVIVGARWRNLVDGYVNGHIGICLYVHSWNPTLKLKFCDLAFLFQKSSTTDDHGCNGDPIREPELGAGIGSPRADKMQPSMPILSRPIIENSERTVGIRDHLLGRERELRNVVRLYSLNDVLTVLREWSEHPGCIFGKSGATLEDRKFQMLLIGRRSFAGFDNGAFINTGVKSRSELVKHLAEFEAGQRRESAEVHWLNPDSPCPIIIHAYAATIGVFFRKVVPDLGEGFAVNVCPIDSLPTVLKSPWHGERAPVQNEVS